MERLARTFADLLESLVVLHCQGFTQRHYRWAYLGVDWGWADDLLRGCWSVIAGREDDLPMVGRRDGGLRQGQKEGWGS